MTLENLDITTTTKYWRDKKIIYPVRRRSLFSLCKALVTISKNKKVNKKMWISWEYVMHIINYLKIKSSQPQLNTQEERKYYTELDGEVCLHFA